MLDALCAALCDKDIARILGYTLKTVKNKNRRVYGKLGVQNRVEAIVFALPFGFGRGSNGYR